MSTLSRVCFDPDTTPPTTPTLVTATALSQSVIRVTWSPSTDTGGSGLAGYRVLRSATSTGTYTQAGSDLSVASLSFDDTGLTAGTTWFYRVVAFDGNANTSSQSTSTSATTQAANPGTGLTWPLHTPGYLSLIPGVGGYGMNTVAGSGRHLSTPATTIILVNSLAAGNTGAALPGLGANVFGGTFEYAWRHSASPKVIIPIVSGWVQIQDSIPCQTGTPPRPGYVSYFGQFAPNPGLFLRGANVATNGASDLVAWHLRSYMGDDVAGLGAGARDCFSSGYAAGTTSRVVLINCEFAWSVDELLDLNRSHSEVTLVNCAFIEPLHVSTIIHPEDGPGVDHGFGPIVGGDTGQTQTAAVSAFRNLWAHTTGRAPLISAQTYVHANNLHYNHGRPTGGAGNAVQIIGAGATEANYANIVGNAFVRGPNNNATFVAISVTGSFPTGSAGYSAANSQFGWTAPANQNAFFTAAPTGYIASSLQTPAYPGSWGSGLTAVLQWAANPLAPTAAEWTGFVDLMAATVGAQPRYRTTTVGRVALVINQIRDRINGVAQSDQFVDTVTEAGGWFNVAQVTIDPLNPGSHWHAALPTGSDRDTPYTSGTFSNGQSRVGYTRLEAWAYEQHLYVTQFDLVSPGVPGNVQVAALSQTTLRVTWDASTDTGGSGLAGYRVFRSTTSTGTYTQVGSDLTALTTSFDDSSLTAGSTRFYRVLAFDGNGNVSAQSSAASGTTSSSGTWADVTVGYSAMPAQLAGTDGRKVRMDITGTDWGVQVDTVNNASVTRVVGGAYDGTDAIRIIPPSGSTPNSNQTYSCIMRGLNLASGGKNVAQVNLGFCVYWGSRYIDLAGTAKITGILASQTIGGAPNASASRAGFFEATWNGSRIFSVTATTVASYHMPVSGIFPDSGTDANKLCLLGTTINHAADPPRVGQEFLYAEQEVDYRRNRGNPDGRNRIDLWSRTGYIGFLEIALTHRELGGGAWDFSYQFGSQIEYIGALWNDPSTANANNFLLVSHPIVAVNRAKDSRIGPPPGFLT